MAENFPFFPAADGFQANSKLFIFSILHLIIEVYICANNRLNRGKQEREVGYKWRPIKPFSDRNRQIDLAQFDPAPSPSRNTAIAFGRRDGELVGK